MGTDVVVGYDGSDDSWAAVEAAAQEASLRGLALRLILGYEEPQPSPRHPVAPAGPAQIFPRPAAAGIVSRAVDRMRQRYPGLRITGGVQTSSGSQALIEASNHAALVVVGNRGIGGFPGLLAGSVSLQVATHARCPVLVVRHPQRLAAGSFVLVGIDDAVTSHEVAATAFLEAHLRRMSVRALHVCSEVTTVEDGRELLTKALADGRQRYPHVEVHLEAVSGIAARILVEASARAGLVVVGKEISKETRGRLTTPRLGSTSWALLHHASCPVLIVPAM